MPELKLLAALLLLTLPVQIAMACWLIKTERMPWLSVSFLFWFVFSLINPLFLAGLSLPYLLPVYWSIYRPYGSFFLPILLLALPLATLAHYYGLRKLQALKPRLQQIALAVDSLGTAEDYPPNKHPAPPKLSFLICCFYLHLWH